MEPTEEDFKVAATVVRSEIYKGLFDENEMINSVASAIAAEREKAAKIAESLQHAYVVDVALKIAAAIRAGDKQ